MSIANSIPIIDHTQHFTPMSLWKQRKVVGLFVDWGPSPEMVSFSEYVALLFAGTPGEYVIIGI